MAILSSWTYDYSNALSMRYAYRMTPLGPEVMTEDKTSYTPAEVKILSMAGVEISPEMHAVKRVFRGLIVDAGRPIPSSKPLNK
jgi:hypothetical protein